MELVKLKTNDLGGVNEMGEAALARARKADLVTLPQAVRGTNCSNCKWVVQQREKGHPFCKHPSVKQAVNQRMCCALWDAKGTYRPYPKEEKYK